MSERDFFYIYAAGSVIVGALAAKKGRSWSRWTLLSFVITPVLGFVALVILEAFKKR